MRKRMSGGARREDILGSAIRLFAEKGFRGATTRELAVAARVTEPILYQHFPNKRALYAAIIDSKAREGHHQIVGQLDGHRAPGGDAALLASLANYILDRYEHDPNYIRLLLFSALENHELAGLFFERQVAHLHNALARYIRARIRAGAFLRVDPHVAARLFLGMVNHHALVRVLFKDTLVKTARKRLVASLVDTFLRGIQK